MSALFTWNVNIHDLQEVFDAVANHLATAKGRSMASAHGGSSCVYRSPKGGRCAVGTLFEGDVPDCLNGAGLDILLTMEEPVFDQHPSGECIELLGVLQSVHDSELSWDGPKFTAFQRLKSIATRHGLTYEVPA